MLIIHPTKPVAAWISLNKLSLFSTETNEILLNHQSSQHLLAACFSKNAESLLVSDSLKQVILFSLDQNNVWTSTPTVLWNIPKKVVKLQFINDDTEVVVADKFGDVYVYAMNDSTEPRQGKLMMGHVSQLTDMLVLPDQEIIITADRDEKIRISKFPKSFIISAFCFGHEEFVSSIFMLKDEKTLISGGGDPYLFAWDIRTGALLDKINIHEKIVKQDASLFEDVASFCVRQVVGFDKGIMVLFEKCHYIAYLTIDENCLRFEKWIESKEMPIDIASCSTDPVDLYILTITGSVYRYHNDELEKVLESSGDVFDEGDVFVTNNLRKSFEFPQHHSKKRKMEND